MPIQLIEDFDHAHSVEARVWLNKAQRSCRKTKFMMQFDVVSGDESLSKER